MIRLNIYLYIFYKSYAQKQKTMNHQMIAWCVIAGVLLCAFIFRAVERHYSERRRAHKPRHIIEFGKDKDIFYIPGDFDEEDDFEDL